MNKWKKLREPHKAALIHDIDLETNGKIVASADKDNPVMGIITHYRMRQIGKNKVEMYLFHPDVAPDKSWEFSSKRFKILGKADRNE